MRTNNCIKLLRTIKKKELVEFEKYLNVFYKQRERELLIFDYIITYAPKYNSEKLQIDNALKLGLAKQQFNRASISKYLSNLCQLLEDYLVWREIREDANNFEKNKILLKILQEKQLEDLVSKKINKIKKTIPEKNLNSGAYYKLMHLANINYTAAPNDKKIIRGNELNYLMENLNGFLISKKLKYACEQMYQSNIFGTSTDTNFLEDVIDLSKKEPYNQNVFFSIFLSILELGKTSNDKLYYQLKDLIMSNYHLEEKEEQSFYFGFLFNYIARELKRGKIEFGEEAEQWIKFGLEKKIVLVNGFLNATLFNNFIDIACNIGKLDLAKEVVQKYSKYLKSKDKEKTLKIANAYIYFEEKKYQQIIDLMKPASFPHKIIDIIARVITLKALYESNKDEELFLFLDAFQKSIRRTKDLSELNKRGALNLIKYTLKLMEPNKQKVIEEVKKTDPIFGKVWLINKLTQ